MNLFNIRHKPKVFSIEIDKDIYFPGEKVKGKLVIVTKDKITCRGIRVHLQGKGRCYFETGSGDNKQGHEHNRWYANSRRTVYGQIYKTSVIDEAGDTAIFGPPWAPDEGVLHMMVPKDLFEIVIRVMDYDFGKKDDLLGEICIDIRNFVDRGEQTIPLTRNGKPEKGTITLKLTKDADVGMQNQFMFHEDNQDVFRLQIIRAEGLRSAEFFGKNDVYVQAYVLPRGVSVTPGKHLPLPPEKVELPPSEVNVPFEFELPKDLPSSMVNYCSSVTYSIYANIDIAWGLDHTARKFITIVQPHVSAFYTMPVMNPVVHTPIYPRICCFPFVCVTCEASACCSSQGTMVFAATLDRFGYAPGEVMRIKINAQPNIPGGTSRIAYIRYCVQMTSLLWADKIYRRSVVDITGWNDVNVNDLENEILFTVPSIAPSYTGGLGQDMTWMGKVQRFGGRWSVKKPDPVVWGYTMRFECGINDQLLCCEYKIIQYECPFFVTGIGLQQLNPMQLGMNNMNMNMNMNMGMMPTNSMDMNNQMNNMNMNMNMNMDMNNQMNNMNMNMNMNQGVVYGNNPADASNAFVVPQTMDRGGNAIMPGNEETIYPGMALTAPSWTTISNMDQVIQSMHNLPAQPYVLGPVCICNQEEDTNPTDASLQYQPKYIMSA